jgi:DNA invertase Pin-like site-specific DNA recombinase
MSANPTRPHIIGYARASITDEDLAAQEEALRKAGCERVFVEQKDRVRITREGAIQAVPFEGELVVTRLDRLAMHMGDLLSVVRQLHHKRAALRVLQCGLVVPPARITPAGSFLDHLEMLAAIEANHFREGRLKGIAKAKARGVYKGRHPIIRAPKVRELSDSGYGVTEIAQALGISRTSVYRALRGHRNQS